MSKKRRNSSSSEDENPGHATRVRTSRGSTDQQRSACKSPSSDTDESGDRGEKPQLDPLSGQTGAFPGLDNSTELFYGPANDGLDYLRMVRSERQGIPGLLKSETEAAIVTAAFSEESDHAGYWDDDGTFTAGPALTDGVAVLPKAQEFYYGSLSEQYHQLRLLVHTVPPLTAIEKLTSSQPISFPPDNKNARLSWEQCFRTTDPTPTQIACMDQSSIFQVLSLFTSRMRGLLQHRDMVIVKRLGAWIWSALARCAERGSLGSEEISDLRKLAQKAADTRNWLEKVYKPGEAEFVVLDHESDDETSLAKNGDTTELDVTQDIEDARRRLANTVAASLKEEGIGIYNGTEMDRDFDEAQSYARAKQAKFVVLDMIILVVGEFYGQRDLLDARTVWLSR